MLTADGVMAMLPHPTWFRGREAVAAFLAATPMRADRRWRMIPVRANGQLAFATYWWDEEREVFAAHGISGAHARRSADLPTSQLPRCRADPALRAPGRARALVRSACPALVATVADSDDTGRPRLGVFQAQALGH